jgi:predicted heme/steroid binding protein
MLKFNPPNPNSFQWQKGIHQIQHLAGTDLTEALKDAPHGAGLLDKFPVVGKLVVKND